MPFDIALSELAVVAIIALVVLGPEKLPVAMRTVGRWIGKAKHTFSTVKNEINRELQIEELRSQIQQQQEQMEKLAQDGQQSIDDFARTTQQQIEDTQEEFRREMEEQQNSILPPTSDKPNDDVETSKHHD